MFFANSGAEANECALKLARRFGGRGRHVVVSAFGSFHGRTLATLHATGQPAKHEVFQPLPEGFRHVAWQDLDALEGALDPTVAAVLLEPVQGEGGVNPATAEYFQGVRRLCDERGILFMVDEVQTGLGRCGSWFAHQQLGVVPDVVTMAKALGNGVPIGACWAKTEVAAAFEPGDHATTYGGQPLATAAARAVLARDGGRGRPGPRRAGRQPDHRRARWRSPGVADVRGLGLLLAIELAEPRRQGRGRPAARARRHRQRRHAHRAAPGPVAPHHRRRDRPRPAPPRRGAGMTVRHVLEIDDLDAAEIARVLDLADDPARPAGAGRPDRRPLLREAVAAHPALVRGRRSCSSAGTPSRSARTRSATGSREPMADIGRVLSGYHAALGARVFDHRVLEQLAAASTIPVVNLLSDHGHPCQSLADLLTMRQELRRPEGPHRRVDRRLQQRGPEPLPRRGAHRDAAAHRQPERLRPVRGRRRPPGGAPGSTARPSSRTGPREAVRGADAVHTDVWASMGQEDEAEQRRRAFEGFQVDDRVMAEAPAHAVFMHCLPAHRGEEVAASVVDGAQSRAFPQAHNRLHAFRGLLRFLLEDQR